MAGANQILIWDEMGPEFSDSIQTGKIRLKLGNNLAIAPDGTISAVINPIITKETLFSAWEIWAEESGGTNANTAEWSFGNGDVGVIGTVIGEGYQITEMWFDADVFAATASIQVDLVDMSAGAIGTTIASIELANSTDGSGQTNNAFKLVEFATPIDIGNVQPIKVGFVTRAETGNISSARVGVRGRRKVGEYISEITF